MGCEAVTKGMGRDLLGNSGAADRIVKDPEDVVVADRLIRVFPGKEPLLWFRMSTVLPQGLQQNGRQHDHSILLPFALMYQWRTFVPGISSIRLVSICRTSPESAAIQARPLSLAG